MNNIIIIGSGFSALTAYLKFKKYNPILISSTNKNNLNIDSKIRKNLNVNKLFSTRSLSLGNFKYLLNKNTKIHDRLTLGGNSNIWGGFININLLENTFIKKINRLGVNFHKLDLKKNGYLSNELGLRQLRDQQNNILDVSKILENCVHGFVNNIELKKKYIKINYYSEKDKKLNIINTSKLFIAISFPQLIDLLFRSSLIDSDVNLSLDEFAHNFSLNFSNKISNKVNSKDVIVKYDFTRILKHFLGYQGSIDRFFFNLPIFIDQTYFNNKRSLSLKLNFNKKIITQTSAEKFGDSIHYCNLKINEHKISKYLENLSKNIIGVSMPFVSQNHPGPISNNIVENIWKNF